MCSNLIMMQIAGKTYEYVIFILFFNDDDDDDDADEGDGDDA